MSTSKPDGSQAANKPTRYSPLLSLARQAKRRHLEMQCDPQWVLDLAEECAKLRKDAERYRWLAPKLYVMDCYTHKGMIHEIGVGAAEVPDVDDPSDAIDAAMREAG